jgi:hypothetical protein
MIHSLIHIKARPGLTSTARLGRCGKAHSRCLRLSPNVDAGGLISYGVDLRGSRH